LIVAVAYAGMLNDPGYENGNIDSIILEKFNKGVAAVNVFVKMWETANIEPAYQINHKTLRAQFVHDTLKAKAAASQENVIAFLKSRQVEFRSHWVVNSVLVYDASEELVHELAARDDVELIRYDREVPLLTPVEQSAASEEKVNVAGWNIELVGATRAWAAGFTGAGVVTANIDTGVRWTHEAVQSTYRGANGDHNYNWWDPVRVPSPTPVDNNGHGTHTMGTIAGTEASGVGVAPGSRWIAAKGCASASCSTADLTSSAEFMVCPTNLAGGAPDCSRIPDLVSNRWGGGSGDTWYQGFTDAWRAAGILPVFAIGNSGSACNTANSPGDNTGVISVAATDAQDVLASFSSRGPGRLTPQKPELSAPGSGVRSAVSTSDTAYAIYSGTSMACPHVAGAVAIVLQANPTYTIDQVYAALRDTTTTALGAPPGLGTCGGVPYTQYPNYHYGFGRINVDQAAFRAAADFKKL